MYVIVVPGARGGGGSRAQGGKSQVPHTHTHTQGAYKGLHRPANGLDLLLVFSGGGGGGAGLHLAGGECLPQQRD